MNQFLFKSRWIAIAFAVLTLFSTYMLVGDEDDGSRLGSVQGAAIAQRDQTAGQLAAIGTAEPVVVEPPPEAMLDDVEFVDDGELIDDASGSDPSVEGGDEGDYADSGDGGDGPLSADEVEIVDGESLEPSDQ